MSILIHDVSIPKDEKAIHLEIHSDGTVLMWQMGDDDKVVGTAIEIPPHGDLIDREKIPFVEAEYACDDYAFRYDINEMTPLIPAEGGAAG